jgi:hypothetical protein
MRWLGYGHLPDGLEPVLPLVSSLQPTWRIPQLIRVQIEAIVADSR